MKKYLLLLASAAFLLVGCAKEQLSNGVDGGMTNVTFTASVDGGVATKAAIDNDGNGTYVNRCIMEIYFQDELYQRMEESTNSGVATFANVPVVAGKQYQILFWADCGGAEKADKYYTTTNLKTVSVAKAAFLAALAAGDNDKLDAFYFADNYTVPQAGGNYDASLKRPFAQLNVITTDVGENKTVFEENLLPEKVYVSYQAANKINVATGEISKVGEVADYTYSYEADVYGAWSTVTTDHKELTLSMDYILAPKTEQGAIDVTFVTKNGGQPVMTHALANLPYKRNYRTNVKGDLLTVAGNWTATIDPIWGMNGDGGEINHIIASSYTDVVSALQSGNDSKNMKVTVTPAAVNNLSDAEKTEVIVDETIDGADVKALKFVLYEEKTGEDAHPASPEHVEFELPARPAGVDAWKIEYEPAYPTETVVVSTKEEDNANVIIEAPKSTVTLDATKINSVVSTTSENTLIIPQGLELKNLTVKKGAVEYHGTGLEKVTVSPIEGANVYFKTSEGLANTDAVYGVVKDYVADGFAITKESETTWKIVPEVCKIGTKSYATLIDAVAAVQSGETIELLKDYEGDGVVVPGGKNFTIDFGGHIYKVIGNMAGSAGTQNQCFQLLKGSTLVFQNGTITTSCAKLGINTYSDVTIKNLTIDMSQTEATGQVACLETCNGTVSIEGESNLIAKEGQIAVLSLYWPNGGYGDINVTLNTTGEVSGLMAYGSYEVQDLSTVAQHSHVAIKNGKYDCTFDMDGLESYDYVISGGVFSTKPDASFAPRGCAFVENTDVATKAKFPWKVGPKPLPGSGTVEDPYQISSAEDLCSLASYSPYTNFILTSDITATAQDYTKAGTYFGKGFMQQLSGVFDGNGHTITFPEGDDSFYMCSILYNGTIKNLNVIFPEEGSLVEIAYNNSKFENVNVGGKLLHFNGNCGAYVTYAYYDVTFENCTCSADITGVGGHGDYNAIFVGYSVSSPGPFVFKNCKYTGEMVTGRSAMFLGNPNSRTINITVENCSNEGTIISTYVDPSYVMNYYYAISGNNYTAFNINGVSHPGTASDQSWVPTCQQDSLVVTTGKAINGPIDSGMSITKNEYNEFVVTPATGGAIGGKTVAKYTVYSGLYVGVSSGSSRFFATEDITPNGSASYTTTMKDYKFVDHTYVNGGTITKIGDNDTFTDATGTYYVVKSDEHTGGHQPESATIHYVAAYDAQGRLLASVSLE